MHHYIYIKCIILIGLLFQSINNGDYIIDDSTATASVSASQEQNSASPQNSQKQNSSIKIIPFNNEYVIKKVI
jgi:hypothetical protein